MYILYSTVYTAYVVVTHRIEGDFSSMLAKQLEKSIQSTTTSTLYN